MKSIFMDVGRNFIYRYWLVVKNFVKLARNSFAQGDDFIISEDIHIGPVNVKESMMPA